MVENDSKLVSKIIKINKNNPWRIVSLSKDTIYRAKNWMCVHLNTKFEIMVTLLDLKLIPKAVNPNELF